MPCPLSTSCFLVRSWYMGNLLPPPPPHTPYSLSLPLSFYFRSSQPSVVQCLFFPLQGTKNQEPPPTTLATTPTLPYIGVRVPRLSKNCRSPSPPPPPPPPP
eukprot:Sspe_Gene.111002::Locus_92167_Transcript_2_2_Confidence_0.600_Length_452::g.111002::m.111002